MDYDINLIPPARLVFYDMLSIPWTVIKDKVPGASDAFTSPNGDYAIVVTGSWVLVYTIEADVLSRVPVQKINLLP